MKHWILIKTATNKKQFYWLYHDYLKPMKFQCLKHKLWLIAPICATLKLLLIFNAAMVLMGALKYIIIAVDET